MALARRPAATRVLRGHGAVLPTPQFAAMVCLPTLTVNTYISMKETTAHATSWRNLYACNEHEHFCNEHNCL